LLGPLGRFAPSDVLRGLIVDFNNMAERLQSLVDAQRVLVRDISHELRSPLARLSVALELAREARPASMTAPLDRIEAEAGRVNELISQLLSLSQMETLKELSPTSNLSLCEVVASVIPDVQYEASGRGCQVVTGTLQECVVYGDPVLLQRAIENVVRNAIRYTPENGIVEIDVERFESNGSALAVVRVKDNGPGVPPDELKSIMRPFYRVDKSRQRITGGYGVGLAIADRAVKLHSGQIKASNKPEGGLIVEMTFPLQSSDKRVLTMKH
jgi:two-component system sensor histidine kinase CpxA